MKHVGFWRLFTEISFVTKTDFTNLKEPSLYITSRLRNICLRRFFTKSFLLILKLLKWYTVKLGYNELGYSKLPLITNRFKFLVGSRYFLAMVFPVIANKNSVITNLFYILKQN